MMHPWARMFKFNDMFCRVYVSPHADVDAGCVAPIRYILADHNCCPFHQLMLTPLFMADPIVSILLICSALTPVISLNSAHGNTNVDPPMDISDDRLRIQSYAFLQISAEATPVDQLDSSQFKNAIMGSGQTLKNATEF